MKIAYFPFTHISERTARLLAALVGPVTVYQPIKTAVVSEIEELAAGELVAIRSPLTDDDDRLRAALAEFTEWARQNPGRSTAGTDFLGARQGEVPFFDETAVNQIRSDLRQYGQSGHLAKAPDDGFSARLFLALAQENDRAVDSLDQDLDRFTVMEKAFLEELKDADEAGFNREAYGGTLWREDSGARLTGQRLRAWARLAMADEQQPEALVTTSPAVVDALVEYAGDAVGIEKLADLYFDVSDDTGEPLLGRVLAGFLDGKRTLAEDAAEAGPAPDAAESSVRVRLFARANQPPKAFIEGLATSTLQQPGDGTPGNTLVVLVEG